MSYTYEVDGLFVVLYKDGTQINRLGPWDVSNPEGPGYYGSTFCEVKNEEALNPPPAPEETPE
jgi:hypothetical protein